MELFEQMKKTNNQSQVPLVNTLKDSTLFGTDERQVSDEKMSLVQQMQQTSKDREDADKGLRLAENFIKKYFKNYIAYHNKRCKWNIFIFFPFF